MPHSSSVPKRIAAGFAVVVALTVALGGFALFQLFAIAKTTRFMAQDPYPGTVAIYEIEAAGIAIPSQGTAGTTFLVGVMNRIFAISHDLSVAYLYHPFAAIGHGRFVAYGALYTQRRSKAPLELRCRRALEAAAQFDSTVRGPYTFLSSTTADKA